jgi:hypothetical protein
VREATAAGPHEYIIGSCSCLATDTFGTVRFDRPFDVGDRLHILDSCWWSCTFPGMRRALWPGILDRSGPLLAMRDECALPTSPAAALYNTTQQTLSRSSQRCTTFEPVSSPAYLVTKQVNRGTLAFSCTPKSMPKDHLT